IARTNIEWQAFRDAVKYTYNGQLGFSAVFYPHAVYIVPDAFEIPVGKDKWVADKLDPIVIDTSGNIDFFPLEFVRQNQSIHIAGKLHNNEKDELKVSFHNFELQQINPFLSDNGVQLKGQLNGNIVWHQTLKKFLISSDVKISDFYLNNYFIGDIKTYTAYQPLNQSLFLRGNLSYNYSNVLGTETETKLKYLSFEGIYYTNKKDSALDIEIEAQPFNLSLLNPILKDIMTIDYAFLYGKGKIEGTFDKVLISGKFKVTDSKIKTDYLNTYHKITGDIEVFPDQIRFDDMKIYNHPNKNIAGVLNGNIFHKNFSNMRLDFDINAKNLLVLNTNSLINKDYYGKIYAAGTIGIYGFINNMNIEANLVTQKNSRFILSFAHAEEVGENSFVKFINPKDTAKREKKQAISGLQMNFILNVNPDLEVEVVLNDKTGDGVKAKGEGVIEMQINSFGKFDMNGEYYIHSGTYLFTLESIINKKFEIEKGSKITLVGNPYNTLININANYIQKASIAPLFPYDSSGAYKRRYPVVSTLTLRGKMISPEILFGIDVPQLDAATKSKIQLLLSDENELNRQFFSLLLLKSFVTPLQYANAGGVSAGSALAANSSEMLSNRLSNALKGISDFVDIGVNYNPGSQNSSQQMELTMSKQMFNNRLSIDGSFGVNSNQAQNTSQIIGDVNIEYKLTESGKYVLKAFNRTNNNTQMTISGGPYTQGVGLGYKYEFDSIFRRKNKKVKK
ncbi:MAG: translocation/assembly module TamB domain-containing protein, partial [Bacteroidia bacterium]|nr:translocation/assembly module TamB domain-containing protein [Bacteroidia bacterium]